MKSVKLAVVVLISCASLQSIMAMEVEQGNQQPKLPQEAKIKTMQEDYRNEIYRSDIAKIFARLRNKLLSCVGNSTEVNDVNKKKS